MPLNLFDIIRFYLGSVSPECLDLFDLVFFTVCFRVSVQGVISLNGHSACLCQGFDFNEVKKKYYYFSKRKGK